MQRPLALTLTTAAALVLTSCTFAVATTEPEAGPVISPARSEFMLQCKDPKGLPVSFWNVEEAWAKSTPDAVHECRVMRTEGTGVVSFSAEDMEAIRLAKGTETSEYWTEERVYALIIESCVSWESFSYTKANPDNSELMRAARIVCPDAPFAEEVDEAIDAHVTVRDAKSKT